MTPRDGTRRLLRVDADLRRSGMLILHTAIRCGSDRWNPSHDMGSSLRAVVSDDFNSELFRPWIVGLWEA